MPGMPGLRPRTAGFECQDEVHSDGPRILSVPRPSNHGRPCHVQRGLRSGVLPAGGADSPANDAGAQVPVGGARRENAVSGGISCAPDQWIRARASHPDGIWRHTMKICMSIDADQRQAALARLGGTPSTGRAVSVGADDTCIRHHQPDAGRHIQVTGGRIERNGRLAARCAFISSVPGWTPDQFKELLRQHGIGPGASMRVIGDGDDGLWNLVQSAVAPRVTRQMDWVRIGMRLERLRKAVQLPMSYEEFVRNPGLFKPLERDVSRICDSLWRGRPWRAPLHLAHLRRDVRQCA